MDIKKIKNCCYLITEHLLSLIHIKDLLSYFYFNKLFSSFKLVYTYI